MIYMIKDTDIYRGMKFLIDLVKDENAVSAPTGYIQINTSLMSDDGNNLTLEQAYNKIETLKANYKIAFEAGAITISFNDFIENYKLHVLEIKDMEFEWNDANFNDANNELLKLIDRDEANEISLNDTEIALGTKGQIIKLNTTDNPDLENEAISVIEIVNIKSLNAIRDEVITVPQLKKRTNLETITLQLLKNSITETGEEIYIYVNGMNIYKLKTWNKDTDIYVFEIYNKSSINADKDTTLTDPNLTIDANYDFSTINYLVKEV